MAGRILAIGGFSLGSRFDDLVLELAGGPRVGVLTREPGAGAYRVERDGERNLEARLL